LRAEGARRRRRRVVQSARVCCLRAPRSKIEEAGGRRRARPVWAGNPRFGLATTNDDDERRATQQLDDRRSRHLHALSLSSPFVFPCSSNRTPWTPLRRPSRSRLTSSSFRSRSASRSSSGETARSRASSMSVLVRPRLATPLSIARALSCETDVVLLYCWPPSTGVRQSHEPHHVGRRRDGDDRRRRRGDRRREPPGASPSSIVASLRLRLA
jgi:hypothetical protein